MDCSQDDIDDFEDNVFSPVKDTGERFKTDLNISDQKNTKTDFKNKSEPNDLFCELGNNTVLDSEELNSLPLDTSVGLNPVESQVSSDQSGENSSDNDSEDKDFSDKEVLRPKPRLNLNVSTASEDSLKEENNSERDSDDEFGYSDESFDDVVSVPEEDLIINYDKVGRWTNSNGSMRTEPRPSSSRDSTNKPKEVDDIHEETQRIIRETYIELPKHEPKQCPNLKEFKKMLDSETFTPDEPNPQSEIDFSVKPRNILDLIPNEILNKPVKMSADADGFICLDDEAPCGEKPEILDLKMRFQKQIANPSRKLDNLSIDPDRKPGLGVIKGKASWRMVKEKLKSQLKDRRLSQYEDRMNAERAERGDENWTVDQSDVEKVYKKDDSSTDEDYNADDDNDSDVTISDETGGEDNAEDEAEMENEFVDEECEESETEKEELEEEDDRDNDDEEEEEVPIVKSKRVNKLFADEDQDDFEDLNHNSIDINFNVRSGLEVSQGEKPSKVPSVNSESDLFATTQGSVSPRTDPSKMSEFHEERTLNQTPYDLFFSQKNHTQIVNNPHATTVIINKSEESMNSSRSKDLTSDSSQPKGLSMEKTLIITDQESNGLINQDDQSEKTILLPDCSQIDPSKMMTQIIESDSKENSISGSQKCDPSRMMTQLIESDSKENSISGSQKSDPSRMMMTQLIDNPVKDNEYNPLSSVNPIQTSTIDTESISVSQKSDDTINDSQIIHDKRRALFDTDDLNGLSEIDEASDYEDLEDRDLREKEKQKKNSRVFLLDDEDDENDNEEKKNFDVDSDDSDDDQSEEEDELDNEKAEEAVEPDEEDLLVQKIKTKKSKRSEFYEEEAELSGSDEEREFFGDQDEVEDIDKQIAELKEMAEQFIDDDDDKRLNKKKIRKELDKLYQRMEHDRDIREIKRIKEMLFEEGDLYNGDHLKRTRKFKWLGLDDQEDFFLKFSDEESDDDDDEAADTNTEADSQKKAELMSQWLKCDNIRKPTVESVENGSKNTRECQEELGEFDFIDKQIENVGDTQTSIDSLVNKLGTKAVESFIHKVKNIRRNPLRTVDGNQTKRQSFLKSIEKNEKQQNTDSLDSKKLDAKTLNLVKNYNLQQRTSLSCFQIVDSNPNENNLSVPKKNGSSSISKKRPLHSAEPTSSTRPSSQAAKKLKTTSIFTAMKTK